MFDEFSNNLKKTRKMIKNIEIKLNKTDYIKKIQYHNSDSSYLRQYKKYFYKKLSIKYNVLPKEYILIQLENFVKAKYCHSLAKFKEDLLFNYEQEFLSKYYYKKESYKKLPLFSEFYKTYLTFFCRPTFSELNLNELIEEMVERKAKAFYQENYQEEEKEKKNSKKIINTIFFTNKIRRDISRKNILTDLSKTTIYYMTTTNKNSINSYISINNLVKEIGGENNKNNDLTNRNAMTSRQINNINKNERINKIIKNMEIISNYKINPNLIKKSNMKNSAKDIIKQQENKPCANKKIKKIKEIKVKSISNTININNNNTNNTQFNFSNKNKVTNNTEANTNRNKESNNNITKSLYHKINIVNNKIIIINNNRSKVNILKVSKEKFKKNNKTSRNYNTNFFSTYNYNTIGLIDSKDRILNNQNYNKDANLLKIFKGHNHKKEQSTKNYNSLQAKNGNKLNHIKMIKEKNLIINKTKTTIQSYNNKKMDSNLFVNYLNNYTKINNMNNNIINKNNDLYNKNILRKKKLTNYQIFSNNINNINHTQKLSNINREKLSPLFKMINSTCSVGTINKNKVNCILEINSYNTMESIPKSKYNNIYRKKCSTQEQYKTKLLINYNSLNKNVLSLKLNKK